MVKIIVDMQEKKCRIIPILNKKCNIVEEKLEIGDYLLSEQCVCERKTGQDFVSSIIDGRLFEQLDNMKQFNKPLIIIEGDIDYENTNVNNNAIQGAIASIITDYQIPLIFTKDQRDSASILYSIAKREQNENKNNVQIKGKKKARSKNHEQELLVASIPGINVTLAQNLLDHFGTPQKIFNATKKQLKKVDKIGGKKAKKIHNLIRRKYEESVLQ